MSNETQYRCPTCNSPTPEPHSHWTSAECIEALAARVTALEAMVAALDRGTPYAEGKRADQG